MTLINKTKLRNKWLHSGNIFMGATISSIVFASSMPVGGFLTWLLLDDGRLTKLATFVPKWMQFIEIEGLEILSQMTPEINFIFYASLIFAIAVTAATVYMLYKTQANSKEIGENNCKSKILVIEEKQTISYHNGIHELALRDYVVLREKYPGGCIIKSKSGRKIVTLECCGVKAENGYYEYQVVEYKNTNKPEITKEIFREDFFDKGKNTRNDVTVCSIGPDTLSTLSDIVLEPRKNHQKGKAEAPAK
jgi:hypothetical protein